MNTTKFIIVVSTALLSIGLVYQQVVNGQEVTSTEEASRQAKEILCKEYNFEYCEGQEVNNNTNSTIKPKPELDCFSLGNIFDPYYGRSRCILK
jgi:hypothetical protein